MTMQPERGDALLVVDVQRDFCLGGALPVEHGEHVVPVLNRLCEVASRNNIPVYASRDWHPKDHCSFAERGGKWPAHCIRHTPGAAFHPDLKLPNGTVIINKATESERDAYSAFDGTDLGERLKRAGVRRVWIGGLAQDVCVKHSVLDARKLGFETILLLDATRPVNAEDGRAALEEMKQHGAVVHEGVSA